MRKLMLAAALVAFAATSGCTSVSPNGSVNLTPSGQTVVADIKAACNVVADLSAITTLVGTFPAGTTAVAIAKVFCQTVNAVPLSAKLKATPATPNAVRINGVVVPYTRLNTRLGARPKAAPHLAEPKGAAPRSRRP
jgi:hypothetical protein